jgi:thiamine biosynthesis lipoprotein
MNTVIDIKVWGINRFKAVKDIEFEINKLSVLFDDFSPNSEVTLINNNAGIKPVKVSYETLDIITKAKDMYDKTDGNFNIMIAPVLKLWGFKSGDFKVPEKSEIEEALKLTDINDLIISGDEVFLKKKGESIDLGGIAKGYALDKVKDIIENDNVTKAVINMGGNVFVYSKNNNEIFTIGIKHPRENGIIATVKVKSGTFVATSGDYERFFEYKGVRYCHIFDPKTGFPANKIVSATAITKTGYVGDVLSTAMFVAGKDGAFELAKRLNASCIIVDKELNVFYTDDLKGVVSVENR